MENETYEKKPLGSLNDESLKKLAAAAKRQLDAERELKSLEDQLKLKKMDLEKVSGEDIPAIMDELGLSEIKLATGESVTIKTGFAASIAKAKIGEAHKWLRDKGFGDLIKNELKVAFAMGDDALASRVTDVADSLGLSYSKKEAVHAGTLKAFVNDQKENGREIPDELFGVFAWNKAVIKGGS